MAPSFHLRIGLLTAVYSAASSSHGYLEFRAMLIIKLQVASSTNAVKRVLVCVGIPFTVTVLSVIALSHE